MVPGWHRGTRRSPWSGMDTCPRDATSDSNFSRTNGWTPTASHWSRRAGDWSPKRRDRSSSRTSSVTPLGNDGLRAAMTHGLMGTITVHIQQASDLELTTPSSGWGATSNNPYVKLTLAKSGGTSVRTKPKPDGVWTADDDNLLALRLLVLVGLLQLLVFEIVLVNLLIERRQLLVERKPAIPEHATHESSHPHAGVKAYHQTAHTIQRYATRVPHPTRLHRDRRR